MCHSKEAPLYHPAVPAELLQGFSAGGQDAIRQLFIVDHPCENEGADQCGNGRQCGIIAALMALISHHRCEAFRKPLDASRDGPPNTLTLPGRLWPDGGDGTAPSRRITMPG